MTARPPRRPHPADRRTTPHPEPGDHLRYRPFSAMLLIAAALLAIALMFANVRAAPSALALNFAALVIRVWGKRAAMD